MRSIDWLTDLSSGWSIEPEKFASGIYGDIFRAFAVNEDGERVGEEVCIKRIDPGSQYTSTGTARAAVLDETRHRNIINFFREAFMQVYVENPAVLPIRGWNIVNENGDPEFIIITNRMNESLDIPQPGKFELTPTEKTIIVYGIARGMQYLHSKRVIHRDLKPDNVFLDLNRYPRIADLGSAKVATTGEQSVRCGQPLYAAPEVWDSLKYRFPADVYSFAMLLYAIFEERIPAPKGIKTQDGIHAAAAGSARPPFSAIKGDLRKMVESMWRGNPERRPTFEKIARHFPRSKYHVPGTDEKQFRKYKNYLDREEEVIKQKRMREIAGWLADLNQKDKVTVQDLARTLRLADLGDSNAQLAKAFLAWSGNFGPTGLYEIARILQANSHLPHVAFFLKFIERGSLVQQGVASELYGSWSEAGEQYKSAAKTGVSEAIVSYGSLLLASGKEEQGVAVLNELASQGNLNAICTLGDYYLRWKRQNDKAFDYFKQAAKPEVNVVSSAPYFITGKLLLAKGQKQEAVAYFDKVTEIEGSDGKWAQIGRKLVKDAKQR